MNKATLSPKSKANDGKTFLWIMADCGGEFKAVVYAAPSLEKMLNDNFLFAAAKQARIAITKSDIKKSTIILPN